MLILGDFWNLLDTSLYYLNLSFKLFWSLKKKKSHWWRKRVINSWKQNLSTASKFGLPLPKCLINQNFQAKIYTYSTPLPTYSEFLRPPCCFTLAEEEVFHRFLFTHKQGPYNCIFSPGHERKSSTFPPFIHLNWTDIN